VQEQVTHIGQEKCESYAICVTMCGAVHGTRALQGASPSAPMEERQCGGVHTGHHHPTAVEVTVAKMSLEKISGIAAILRWACPSQSSAAVTAVTSITCTYSIKNANTGNRTPCRGGLAAAYKNIVVSCYTIGTHNLSLIYNI
jgi:hypothetical protein